MMAQLRPEQRIAQLLHVPAWSNRGPEHEAELLRLVEAYAIGGIIFFQGTARRQAGMCNRLQAAAQVPLFISIDGEWGLAMRLEDTLAFPYAVTLGAIQDEALIYACGQAIGRQCRRLGIHINHAPVVDINTEAANPVIGFRAFGSEPERIARQAVAFLKGQQDAGVMAVAKHFPGHGDTAVDSHLALPLLRHDLRRFREWEWYPFQQTFEAGVGGVMVAHLAVPALEADESLPASLSPTVIGQYLREELGFEGLVFSDALNMKGATGRYEQGEGDVLAVKAGHDVLVYVEDVPAAVASIRAAIDRGEISQEEIDRRVRRQLAAKYAAGMALRAPIQLDQLEEDLHSGADQELIRLLFQQAATLLGEDNSMLPLQEAEKFSFVVFSKEKNTFWQTAFPQAHHFVIEQADQHVLKKLRQELKGTEKLIISLHGLLPKAGLNFGLDKKIVENVEELLAEFPTVLLLPCNPYVLGKIGIENAKSVLLLYEDRLEAWEAGANILQGNMPAYGRLSIKPS